MKPPEFYIGHCPIGTNHPPMIVAELSGNHHTSLQRALKMVEAAKKSGVTAIKLQTYTPDTITLNIHEGDFVIRDHSSLWYGKTLYDLYKEAYTPWDWHKPIFDRCRELGLIAFSSPFDETAVDFLESFDVPCYKIASLEIVDLPLIRKAAATGKPLILSTGAASLEEIALAVETARNAGCKHLILLKCTLAYPSTPSDCHLRTIPHLAESFNTHIGLSDHTLSLGVPIASVALGACLIEKHFTLSRADGDVDGPFSLEPHEFTSLVEESRKAWESLGTIRYTPLPSEKTSLSHRPSLFFIADLEAGTAVEEGHIKTLRPNSGLAPKELPNVIGKQLLCPVKKGTPVAWHLFNGK